LLDNAILYRSRMSGGCLDGEAVREIGIEIVTLRHEIVVLTYQLSRSWPWPG